MWIPVFACPFCRTDVADDNGSWLCASCGRQFSRRQDGICCFASADELVAVFPFLQHYRVVRASDGHAIAADAYRRLPEVAADDPNLGEWQVRQQSARTLTALAGRMRSRQARVLDLGAGNAWLSNHVSAFGHSPVAVDLDDDRACGLGAGLQWSRYRFPFVQADFERPPFAPGQFDLVVLNASLHYSADPLQTLREADRMVSPGGALVVMDSPMFERADAGEAMVARQMTALMHRCGGSPPLRRGRGYLTFAELADAGRSLGRRTTFIPSHGSIGWRVRRVWSRLRLGRAPAAFGVWVAQ